MDVRSYYRWPICSPAVMLYQVMTAEEHLPYMDMCLNLTDALHSDFIPKSQAATMLSTPESMKISIIKLSPLENL